MGVMRLSAKCWTKKSEAVLKFPNFNLDQIPAIHSLECSSSDPIKRTLLSECSGCGVVNVEPPFAVAVLTHKLRHGGIYRRFCTACVLKNHPGSFCPICFEVYDDNNPLPVDARVMCLTCPSISHSSCVISFAFPSFRCPPCSNPNFSFFRIAKSEKIFKSCDNHDGGDSSLGKQFLAAATIAAFSLNKAADLARVKAERRAKEAILAKERAKDALERFFVLTSKNEEFIDTSKIEPLAEKLTQTCQIEEAAGEKDGDDLLRNSLHSFFSSQGRMALQ